MTASTVMKTCPRSRLQDDRSWTSKKVSALQIMDETPPVASGTLAPDFDGYLFAITMDSSWNETVCPLIRPSTALATRRANATLMSHGLSVFLLIDSGSAVTGCPRDRCPNLSLRETKPLCFHSRPQARSRPWSTMARSMCHSPLLDTRA